MGISLAEYLAQKQSCDVCNSEGNQHHCISNLLSRVDNCVFYNTLMYFRDEHSVNDVVLLQEMRYILDPDTVLYYYVTAEPVVKNINQRRNSLDIWIAINQRFVKDIFVSLRDHDREAVKTKIEAMLTELGKEYQ